jgi:endoglucanase
MTTTAQRRAHERWLREVTMIPTAAAREHRVIAWVERWVAARSDLRLRRDSGGNLIITRRRTGRGGRSRPVFVTAHLDHPAFVLRRVIDDGHVEMEFRGGVHDPYFDEAPIEIHPAEGPMRRATIVELRPKAKPFKRVVAKLARGGRAGGTGLAPGDVGRWALRGPLPRVTRGIFHTHACDDLAAVAAALATLDRLRRKPSAAHVGVLLTRAEEIGFVGTLHVCAARSVPASARLICLENSRSFPDSPIGAGPILRVGDKMSVFDPALTNRIADLLMAHQKKHPDFRWQRKLMPGGSCEATAFSTYGYESTCVCLPLGNYHNMTDIDGVLAGRRPARVGPEHIALDDYHGMIELLVIATTQLDTARLPTMSSRLDKLLADHGHLLSS